MNQKYNFSYNKLGDEGLKIKLREANEIYRESRDKPIKYMKMKGMKFYRVLDGFKEFFDKLSNTSSNQI